MMPSAKVVRGVRAVQRLLREQIVDLRRLDLAGFRFWLRRQLAHWQRDPTFIQRSRIRDLRRSRPDLVALEKAFRDAVRADAAAASFPRLERLERELIGATRAVTGLQAALERTVGEKRAALREKLKAFQARCRALRHEKAQAIRSSPERPRLLRVARKLERLRVATGLEGEESRLNGLTRRKGQRSNQSGRLFEQLALEVTRDVILSDLLGDGDGEARRPVRVLRAVTLGTAATEFDQVVVRQRVGDDRPVEVLAVVEAKRNINDLAHGFRHRQEDLAWLTGDTRRYDPARHQTRSFPSGHFDGQAIHQQDGETFRFDRGSFRWFRADPASGYRLDRLFLITRAGSVWGVSAAALARIRHRAATDERWQPDDDAYLRSLLAWCQGLAEPIETPDVLRLYALTPRWGRQVIIVKRAADGGE